VTGRLVVDASVAVKWYAEEPDTPVAMQLMRSGAELIAPDLIYAEVLNALWNKSRRGLVDQNRIASVPRSIEGSFAEILPLRPLADEALALSASFDHPIYDCFYLAAALRRDCELVTCDARLLQRLVKSPHRGRVMPLADWRD
jgi:predicted nucleic acid-binding protein